MLVDLLVDCQKETTHIFMWVVVIYWYSVYSRRDLNPHSRNGHGILSPACLPIPPLEQLGAKNGTRTRDPNLGKVMLYQLSYFRIVALFSFASAKVDEIFVSANFWNKKMQGNAFF